MSFDPIESEVQKFYADAGLSRDRVDSILAHGQSIAAARRWKRLAIASTLTLSGTLIVCIFLFFRLMDEAKVAVVPEAKTPEVKTERSEPARELAGEREPRSHRFQLIAVRNHGDRCPHCRASSEVFAELKESLADREIEFTLIDLRRDSENLEDAQKKYDAFHLDRLVAGRDKALLAVSDRAGNFYKLDVGSGTDQLLRFISGLLDQ